MNMSTCLSWVAAITIVLASIIALRKDNLKARLAYSTVSQLAYITFAAMLATPAAFIGGALQIVMHAWGKITLFMCAGAIYTISHRTEISKLDGLGRTMPWVFGAFLVGFYLNYRHTTYGRILAKILFDCRCLESGKGILTAALVLSSILNIVYSNPNFY